MKVKVTSLISWIALLISVQVYYCNTSNAESPLSAIDWLSDIYTNIDKPNPLSAFPNKEPNEFSIATPKVDTKSSIERTIKLDIGNIYKGTLSSRKYNELLLKVNNELPPPLLAFLYTILSVKSRSPEKSVNYDDILLIRLNKLLEFGAIPQAQNLLEELDINNKKPYNKWFNIHLLSSSQKEACDIVLKNKASTAHYRDRIFCLIQSGNTKVATLTLSGAAALDILSLEEEIILYNFLYSNNAYLQTDKQIIQSITPMNYRVSKLIGASVDHLELSSAYHHSELMSNISGNKKLLYTENLVRNGVLPYRSLNSIYSDVTPDLDGSALKRANLSKELDDSLSKEPTLRSLRKFVEFFDNLADVGLENFALRYYSMDLLKIVNQYPNSRKALTLLIRSADLKALRKIRNKEKLNPIYRSIIFKSPINIRATSLSEKLIIDSLQKENIPEELEIIMRDRSSGEAILTAIIMLQEAGTAEITNVIKGITFFNALGFTDLASEVLIYKIANNETNFR